jgi:hypothetical protein
MLRLLKLFAIAAALALALPTAAMAKAWWVFHEFEGSLWVQNLMLILAVVFLLAVLFIPNILRKAGKWPEGW